MIEPNFIKNKIFRINFVLNYYYCYSLLKVKDEERVYSSNICFIRLYTLIKICFFIISKQ